MKKTILFFLLISASSCKTNYNTVEFRLKDIPPAPDYSKNESWAVLPNLWNKSLEQVAGTPEKKRADVFYIYPTLFSNKKSSCWNANIFDPQIRKDVIEKAVTYQASAWVKAANLYVPFYRQAHYRIFVEPYATQGREAGIVAYQDVKNAFIYFLNNYNNSRPIIIASHSMMSITFFSIWGKKIFSYFSPFYSCFISIRISTLDNKARYNTVKCSFVKVFGFS